MTRKIGKDIIEHLNNKLEGMAESHLEGWGNRYSGYSKNDLKYDLQINHDPSIEIEYTEEQTGRKLTDEEYDYVVDKFNKAVVNQYHKE